MAMEEKYDVALLGILQHEGKIEKFLNIVLGFLYRRTDFYRLMKDKNDKLGFPPGVALKMLTAIFKEYDSLTRKDDEIRLAKTSEGEQKKKKTDGRNGQGVEAKKAATRGKPDSATTTANSAATNDNTVATDTVKVEPEETCNSPTNVYMDVDSPAGSGDKNDDTASLEDSGTADKSDTDSCKSVEVKSEPDTEVKDKPAEEDEDSELARNTENYRQSMDGTPIDLEEEIPTPMPANLGLEILQDDPANVVNTDIRQHPVDAQVSSYNDHDVIDTGIRQHPVRVKVSPDESSTSSHVTDNIVNVNKNNNMFTCGICEKSFTAKSSLKKHILYKHSEATHKCLICSKNYPSEKELRKHIKGHSSTFECQMCSKTYKTKATLTMHMKDHNNDYKFCCQYCGKRFNRKFIFDGHVSSHTSEKHHKCEKCGKSYQFSTNLKRHMNTCLNQSSNASLFVCEICGKKFKRKDYLKDHLVIHQEPNKYQCQNCGRVFAHRATFHKHTKRQCEKELRKRNKVHSSVYFVCKVCNKKYNTKTALKLHEKEHNNDFKFNCQFCGKGFNRKFVFDGHVSSHTSEKHHKCEKCGKSYQFSTNLKRHMNVCLNQSSNVSSFECEICGKKYKRKDYLREHQVIHQEPGKYQCQICDKKFSHRSSFYKHSQVNC